MTPQELVETRSVLTDQAFGRDPAEQIRKLVGLADRPSYRSGIWDIDRQGGLQGFSVLGGNRKAGKSLLAMRIGIEAAREGWTVLHYDLEVFDRIFARRFWAAAERSEDDPPRWLLEGRYKPVSITETSTIHRVAAKTAQLISEADDRVLIVIDSMHRLAKQSDPAHMLQALARIVGWCATACRLSPRLAVVGVAEVNRAGGIIGLDAEYAADGLITLEAQREEWWKVSIDFASRYGPSGYWTGYSRLADRVAFEAGGQPAMAPETQVEPERFGGPREHSEWWGDA